MMRAGSPFIQNYHRYGQGLNSWDAIKFLAIAIMIVDHVGYFFFPENVWWRAIGIGAPIWFFLCGYARPSKARMSLYWLAGIMVLADIAMSQPVLPVNNLVSIIVCRAFIAWFSESRYREQGAGFLFIMLLVWYPLTFFLFEYGSPALMIALAGYWYRNAPGTFKAPLMLVLGAAVIALTQIVLLQYTPQQTIVFILTMVPILYAMHRFEIRPLLASSAWWSVPVAVIARNSLYLYAGHYILFEAIHYMMYPPLSWSFQLLPSL